MTQALTARDAEVHYKDIIESTSAVLFLGTPHGGSDYAAITKPIVNIAHVTLPKPFGTFRKDLIGSLERNGSELLELSNDFRYIVDKKNITLYSFVEQDRHPLLSSRVRIADWLISISQIVLIPHRLLMRLPPR